jgi:DNA-binding IclR family transcriptional regulator
MSAITRSIQAMDLLARKGPLGVRAVAQQLELPLGSVHRLLHDLAEEGIVDRTLDGEWELSYRLLEITSRQLERIDLPRLCRPFAEQIAEATRETVNINALSGHNGVCIDKVRGNEMMQLDLRIGSRGALNCGGAGKAMLAFMTEAEREQIYLEPMAAHTTFTITEPALLREEIDRIRARFYSIDDQEVVLGVYCVAVPILDRFGRAAGALSVTGPSVKRPGPELQPIVDLLWGACGHVSRRLGFAGQWPPFSTEPSN